MPSPSVKPQGRPRRDAAGYEKRDASAKWIFGIVAFLLVAGIIMHFAIAGVMERLQKTPFPTDRWTGGLRSNTSAQRAPTAFPRLQIAPAEDLKLLRTREELELSTYGWINKTADVVRIPIDRAMDLALQRGFPVRNGINGSKLGPSSYELQQQRSATAEKEISK